ncbi:MAG: recombinase family protein [Clostridiales bacterium]|nr:recombinase family protein [Clostridiales bacterium]
MSKQKQLNKIGIYMRLSRDDEKAGESMSIDHQRIILRKYVEEHGGNIVDEYIDDGWSGTNFDRPEVKRLLGDAQSGKIDTIIVKDLSRFGRNYIQVGQYIDYIFPAYGIRFIALNDNVDTADRSSTAMDMMPIMNVFNEWHAANTSKKIRAVFEANQRAGKYTNWNYPYGYKAGNDESRTAVIDEEAAMVVRRIFDLRLQGNSARTIARILTDDGIPNPATYFTKLDGGKWDRNCSVYWVPKTVRWILSNPTYIGHMVQHKTTTVSYKNHKVVSIPKNEWIINENAHEPIISKEIWDMVQETYKSTRGRADKTNLVHILSGLVVCPDCRKKFKLKSAKDVHDCFVCRTYVNLGKKYCSSHHITEKQLEAAVLDDIRSLIKFVEHDETKFKEQYLRERAKRSEQNRYSDEKQLKSNKNRLIELDKLIQSAFEEKVLKSMPESVCVSLCKKYQAEKESLQQEIIEIQQRLSEFSKDDENAEEYVRKIKRYSNCESLSREMCLQLIDYITVGEKVAKNQERIIHIHYKFQTGESLAEYQQKRLKTVP